MTRFSPARLMQVMSVALALLFIITGSEGMAPFVTTSVMILLANIVYAASAESLITFFPLYGMHFGMTKKE